MDGSEPRWFKIDGYDYSVSDRGDIRNDRTGRIKATVQMNRGYMQVALWKDGIGQKQLVHRIVATAFIPNPHNKPQVNHINGIKADNRVENLEWATESENQVHRYRVLKKAKTTWNVDAENDARRKVVRCIETGRLYRSISEAAKENGLYPSSLSSHLAGKNKTCGGRHWEYA
jgi:hypothetical protein